MWNKAGVGPLRGAVKAKRRIKGKWDDVTAGSGWWWAGGGGEAVRLAQQPSEDACCRAVGKETSKIK